jgi:hypothetical protein
MTAPHRPLANRPPPWKGARAASVSLRTRWAGLCLALCSAVFPGCEPRERAGRPNERPDAAREDGDAAVASDDGDGAVESDGAAEQDAYAGEPRDSGQLLACGTVSVLGDLAGTTVTLNQHSTTTDDAGNYCLPYAPGTLVVSGTGQSTLSLPGLRIGGSPPRLEFCSGPALPPETDCRYQDVTHVELTPSVLVPIPEGWHGATIIPGDRGAFLYMYNFQQEFPPKPWVPYEDGHADIARRFGDGRPDQVLERGFVESEGGRFQPWFWAPTVEGNQLFYRSGAQWRVLGAKDGEPHPLASGYWFDVAPDRRNALVYEGIAPAKVIAVDLTLAPSATGYAARTVIPDALSSDGYYTSVTNPFLDYRRAVRFGAEDWIYSWDFAQRTMPTVSRPTILSKLRRTRLSTGESQLVAEKACRFAISGLEVNASPGARAAMKRAASLS